MKFYKFLSRKIPEGIRISLENHFSPTENNKKLTFKKSSQKTPNAFFHTENIYKSEKSVKASDQLKNSEKSRTVPTIFKNSSVNCIVPKKHTVAPYDRNTLYLR